MAEEEEIQPLLVAISVDNGTSHSGSPVVERDDVILTTSTERSTEREEPLSRSLTGLDVDGFSHKHLTCHRESNRLYTDPVTLPCLDTYCSACLEKYGKEQIEREGDGDDLIDQEDNAIRHGNAGNSKKRSFRCPLGCETETGIELSDDGSLLDLPHVNQSFNNVINTSTNTTDELSSVKSTIRCGQCKTQVANAICNSLECSNIPLCSECMRQHTTAGTPLDDEKDHHDIVYIQHVAFELPGATPSPRVSAPLDRIKPRCPRSMMCHFHSGGMVDGYCEEHDQVTCHQCERFGHRFCTIKSVNEVCEEYANEVQDKVNVIKEIDSKFRVSIAFNNKMKESLEVKREEVKKELTQRYNKLIEQIIDHYNNLVDKTDQICELKMNVIDNYLAYLNRVSGNITRHCEFIDEFMTTAVPSEFMFLKTQLSTGLDDMIRRYQDFHHTPTDNDEIYLRLSDAVIPENYIGTVNSTPFVKNFKCDTDFPDHFQPFKVYNFSLTTCDILGTPLVNNELLPTLEAFIIPADDDDDDNASAISSLSLPQNNDRGMKCYIKPNPKKGKYTVSMFVSFPGNHKVYIYSPRPYPHKQYYIQGCPFDVNVATGGTYFPPFILS